tara:strand:+ start:1443 stop:1643 length:201 start_codon:yes stop_codon:yes gene_type:complete
MSRTAYYLCTGSSYCVVESDMVTEISQYKACDLPSDDPEVGDSQRGVYDAKASTFTFDTGGTILLS